MTKHQNHLLPDFENISYLQHGSAIQQSGYNLLHDKKILYHLKSIGPVLAGTLPLNIFIEGKSDLDILCSANDFGTVEKILLNHFSSYELFFIEDKLLKSQPTMVCRFTVTGMPIEIFIQPTPVKQQYGYRHMVIEHWLLKKHGETFRHNVLELKRQGMKTELAFARLLNLTGDPYETLLHFENDEGFLKYSSAKA